MKKFLKSLGQLNSQQIKAIITLANLTITTDTVAQLTTSNNSLTVVAQMVDDEQVTIKAVIDNEDINTHLNFIYNVRHHYFTGIQMLEVPKVKAKLIEVVVARLSNPQK